MADMPRSLRTYFNHSAQNKTFENTVKKCKERGTEENDMTIAN